MITTTTVPDHAAGVLTRMIDSDNGSWSQETAEEILSFQLSEEDRNRVNDLAAKARAGELTPDDRAELDGYEIATALVELLQSKARRCAL